MKPTVIDASVAVKWFIPESASTEAMKFLHGRYRLAAPELVYIEVANVLWKLHQRSVLSRDETLSLVEDLLSLPLMIHDSKTILGAALEIATATQRTVYDSLYLALAIELDGIVITADERWVNALSPSPFGRYLRLLA